MNKITLDERQTKFLGFYLDPKSKTFSNALQSALKAGFEQEYAENITSLMPNWLSESIGKGYLINKAEKNLKEFLENASEKVKADITKFVLERLSRGKYGKEEGQTLNQINVFYIPESLAKKYGIEATSITRGTKENSE